MEIILREEVVTLGHVGDVIKVKDGYARNYLLPNKLAIKADPRNKKMIEHEKKIASKKLAKIIEEARSQEDKLNEVVLAFERQSGESGKLFGSVTNIDIAHELEKKGFLIDRRRIELKDHLKSVGEYSIAIKLHRDIQANIKVIITSNNTDEPLEATPETEIPAEPAS